MENAQSKTIFLSYSWNDDVIANDIDSIFTNAGIKIVRDRKELNYKDSIKDFMRKINDTSFVILLISKSYLESSNCMFEVLELLKDPNYKKRILPIFLIGVNIFKPQGRIALLKYWDSKISENNILLKELDNLANANSIIKDIEHFTKIRSSIDGFISTINDLNCLNIETLQIENYKPILDFIGYSIESIEVKILEIITIRDIEEREIEINSLLNKFPNQINLLLLRANLTIEKNQNNLAISYYSEILAQHPNLPEAHNNLGIAYRNLGKFENAIDEFNISISINSKFPNPYVNLGLIYSENLLDYDKAKSNFIKALELDYNISEAHFGYANLLFDQKNIKNQREDFVVISNHYMEAIRLIPPSYDNDKSSAIHYNFANFLFHQNNYPLAKNQYLLCIKLTPNKFEAHCNLAVTARRLGILEELNGNLKESQTLYKMAQLHYELALDIDAKDVVSNNNLANLFHHNLKDNHLAEHYYKKARKINPEYMPENYEQFKLETGLK